MKTISIGNSTIGYHIANVVSMKSNQKKYRIVKGTENGSKNVLKKSIANINRGDNSYVNTAGDSFHIYIS